MARAVADRSFAPPWFVVLPDCDVAEIVISALRAQSAQELRHPSGRPWILGAWSEDVVTVGQAGQTKIAVIGQHAITPAELAEAALRSRTAGDLDRLAASLVGSSHLVASLPETVRVQGTITGVRRVFHARVGGAMVAADRADVLASLVDAAVDEQRLAVHLLDPPILYPLAGQPVWQNVALVPTDHYLVLKPDRRWRTVKWWTPPEPVVPMAEGAPALRKALSAAVEARVRRRELVSCDLGGVDSTAVCSLAAHGRAQVFAYTAASPDPLADDVLWAARTVSALGSVEHHVIPASEMPLVYHGVLDADERLDEPCAATVDRDRWLTIARRAAERGSRLHLTGFGGDELLYGSLAHLHSLVRTSPAVAVRHLRGFAAKYRWPRGEMVRQLRDSRPYRAWLRAVAEDLTAPPRPLEDPLLDWGFQPRLPPWVTRDAVDAVRELICAEARSTEPFAPTRGQHRELETMRFVSRVARHFGQVANRFGVALATPYYDDRVIEAGLAVRPQDRITPSQYKPLITEAMRGIVPAESLARSTKANGTCDEEPGQRRHRAELLALCDESRLARRGLIDADALREACSRPLPPYLQISVLHQSVACEVWLRTLEPAVVPI
jgi:asparagine synthase (glutamine-hydrolysing)